MSGTGANLPIDIRVGGVPEAERAFNTIAASGERAMQRVHQGTTQAAGSAGNFRSIVGQAGFQLQDFAVQVQGGTSALTALSQQGSQFLGAFGAGGAIAGAVLTVGILAAQLLGLGRSAAEAEKETKRLDEAVKKLFESYRTFDRLLRSIDSRLQTPQQRAAAQVDESRERLIAEADAARRTALVQQDAAEQQLLRAERNLERARGNTDAGRAPNLAQSELQTQGLRARVAMLRQQAADAETAFQRAQTIPTGEAEATQELRRSLDDRYRIMQDYEARVAQLARSSSLSEAERGRLERLARQERDDALRALANRGATGTREGTADQLRTTLDNLRGQEDGRIRQEVERFTQSMELPIETYKRRMAEIESLAQRARENGNPIPEEAIQRATDEALGAFNSLARGMEQNNQLGQQLGMTFSSAFEDAIVKGKSFRDVLSGVAQDLARLIVRQSITAPLGNAISKSIGGFDLSSIGSSIAGVFGFGGGKATGGPVMGGTTYLVGERGPELFTPGASGAITPNHAIGGNTTWNVNIDARGATLDAVARLEARMPSIIRAVVGDDAQRGGGFARALRGR